MNVDILSLNEAQRYTPGENTYGIRIFSEFLNPYFYPLRGSENWIDVKTYVFDDVWPKDFREYGWADINDSYFSGVLTQSWEDISKEYPKMTKESLLSYAESKGQPDCRYTLFNEEMARKILSDFDAVKNRFENVMIHCTYGKNRSPAVGIAMNEIYDWGIVGLEKKFPGYRRYVYEVMKKASGKFK